MIVENRLVEDLILSFGSFGLLFGSLWEVLTFFVEVLISIG